jgi:hypothetical protein
VEVEETGVEEMEGNGEEFPNMDVCCVDCVEKCGSVEKSNGGNDAGGAVSDAAVDDECANAYAGE